MAKRKKQLTPLQQAYKHELQRIMRGVKRAEKQGYIFDEAKLPKPSKRISARSVAKLQKIKPADLKAKAQKIDYETGDLISGKKALKIEKRHRYEKAKETRRQNKINKINSNDIYTLDNGQTIDITTGEIIPNVKIDLTKTWSEDELYEYGVLKEPEEEPEPVHDREKYNKKHKDTKYQKPEQDKYPRFSTIVIDNFMNDISHFPELAYPMLGNWIQELIRNYGEDDVAEMLENAKANGIWIDYSVAYSRDLLLGMISEMMEYLPDASEQFKKDLAEQFEYGEDWSSPD